MASTNRPTSEHIPEVLVASDYEDAVSSGEELANLCNSLKNHLVASSKMRRENKKSVSKMLLTNRERMAKCYSRESSSEHSSLEKLQPAEMHSRRPTGSKRRSNSGSDHSSDWKVLNFAFQEMAHYPLLMQLNEQLMEISRQLNSVEATNALQLKVIMHLLNRMHRRRNTWVQSFFRFLRIFIIIILSFTWRRIFRWFGRLQFR
ncbi:hypothetical protein B9Z55_008420 [Caenorhabditis nigoni]|uniref:Uncharacterized protein n=1 Tax=Caenorhabditis nigoni TaxID=1611254 RepID=A0A2G5UMM7_9PELO|nr:hypothetical protein B9Z55_008420 [Caenorhabditis nigoni]